MPEGEPIGVGLAKDLVSAIVRSTEAAQVNGSLMVEIRDLLEEDIEIRKKQLETQDELCGHMECLSVAFNVLADVGANGKKLTLNDFVHAYAVAVKDVFGDEDDDGEDGDGDDPEGDPVPSGGRKREA